MPSNNNNNNLTVLLAPCNYVGPMMASIGMAEVLRDAGHRPVFAVKPEWIQKIQRLNFDIELLEEPESTAKTTNSLAVVMDSAEKNVSDIQEMLANRTPMDQLISVFTTAVDELLVDMETEQPYLTGIIAKVRPNVIITDHILINPSIYNSQVPYIMSYSSNPLNLDTCIEDRRLPPGALGLSLNGDNSNWENYRQQLIYPSPYATIYMYPKELDYTDVRPLPETFHRFDNFRRTGNEDVFELPKQLSQRSGKLVYLLLGSMGSGNVDLMKRLVAILAKSEHRFIVSKGVKHDKYELADNMWGERFVPQVKVLPIVDLFITHGGNNSFTECMSFGKPMIVFPLFFDQFDNAQRVEDKGYDIRLNPYECSEQQLLQSINKLLNDKQLIEKCNKIGLRIQNEKNNEKFVKLVENVSKLKK
ncbi:NDP-glycosyltransferase YjiC-like [Oppia nitens]|uniref:NDP-glycosyltransferase YjiC-like n=1 Tax=Oppia nitens TaxID=1686743 RepID=UPI0023DAAB78|nr:NDP-glycosyltransferase YjiC-like [Oppia nitens]